MSEYPESIDLLIEQFRKLPTIGRKTAQRLALHVIGMNEASVDQFARTLVSAKRSIHRCAVCGNLTDREICPICLNAKRDHSTVCVVEDATNLIAIERGGSFRGVYHVLNGLISPMRDFGPDQIGVDALLDRITGNAVIPGYPYATDRIREIILAISATVEGETTILFLAELLKSFDVKVSRIASGIPVGGSLEFFDELTLARALEDRRPFEH